VLLVLVIGCLCGPGCAISRGPAVPSTLTEKAVLPGMEGCRIWADDIKQPAFERMWDESIARERALVGAGAPLPPADFLVISGGGPDGAYGAGIICAWTEAGNRPQFKVVTGVSTGALTAPFAFLGPDYDHVLKEVYTSLHTSGIMESRWLLAALFGDALDDTVPLQRMLAKLVDQAMLERIAAEYKKGRLLLIGTTDLDVGRPVIWDIGAIASSGAPKALETVRKIMIASAAIPAAFPPVMFDVEVDGKKYQELHVDGGAIRQAFLYPPHFHLKTESVKLHAGRTRTAWIIRNARLDPDWASTQRQTLRIAARAISALLASEGKGDLDRMYLTTRRDGVGFNLAFIPPDFDVKPKEDFDPDYMRPLFERGRSDLLAGKVWKDVPPEFDEADFKSTIR